MITRLRIFYDLWDAGEGHAQIRMRNLSDKLGFKILGSQPQSLFDGWEFWVEFEGTIAWPEYIRVLPWQEVSYPH